MPHTSVLSLFPSKDVLLTTLLKRFAALAPELPVLDPSGSSTPELARAVSRGLASRNRPAAIWRRMPRQA